MGLADELNLAMRSAPEYRQDPTIAITAAQMPGNSQEHAEVASHLMNQKAIGSAVDETTSRNGGKGIFGATLGWLGGGVKGAMDFVGHGIATVGHVANQPLEQVKHQYRYLRDVQARHGFGEMLLNAIPMTAGGAIGGLLGGGYGIGIGVAAAGQIQEWVGGGYKDSWERTSGPDYKDPHGGSAVSPGRDAARFLGALSKHVGVHIEQHAGFDLYDAVSGLGDGLFSVAADPLMQAGTIRKEMKAGEASGLLVKQLATKWGGIPIKGADLAKVVAENPGTRRGLEHLATLNAGEIGARYRKLRPFARELGEADTMEKVGQVFIDRIGAAEMTQRTLPRRPIANAAFGDLLRGADARLRGLATFGAEEVEEGGRTVLRATQAEQEAGKLEGLGRGAIRRVGSTYKKATTFVPASYNATTNEMSRTTLYMNDPGSAGTVYDLARWGHTDRMAKHVAEQYSRASIADRQLIVRNVLTDNLANTMELTHPGWSGTADGSEALARLGDQIDGLFGGIDAGRTTPWGYDSQGRTVSRLVKNGETLSVPVLEGQHINVPMPDYMTFAHNLTALRGSQTSKFLAGADDLLYQHFTQRVFKRWALTSGGFAIRAVAQDLVPYVLKAPGGMVRGGLTKQMAKRGWEIAPEEEQHIVGAMTGWLANKVGVTNEGIGDTVALMTKRAREAGLTEDDVTDVAIMIKKNHAHVASAGVRAGHGAGVEIDGIQQYVNDELYHQAGRVPKMQRDPNVAQSWSAGHKDYNVHWHAQAKEIAEQSPATRAAAAEYSAAKAEGASEFEATHRATLKAKSVLDTTDESILNQNERHFTSLQQETPVLRGANVATNELEWVPGKAGRPGRYELTGQREYVGRSEHQMELFGSTERPETVWVPPEAGAEGGFEETGRMLEAGQTTAQPSLVNPRGNVPGGLRGPGTVYGGMGEEVPLTTMYKEKRWVPGIEGKEGRYELTGRTQEIPMEFSQGQMLPGTWVDKQAWIEGIEPEAGFFQQTAAGQAGPQLVEQPRLPHGPELVPGEGYAAPDVADPHMDWANTLVENMKGTVYGQDGTLHDEVLNALAEGRAPDWQLMKDIAEESQPAKIIGAYEKPAAPSRLNNSLFRKLNTFINWAAREPIYQHEYLEAMREFRPMIGNGLTYDEAMIRAETRATKRMLPHIDNAAERTLMAEHARNWIPFYAAQQQAYARMFRLLAEDPAAFRRVQLAYTSMADFGGVYDDQSQSQHMVIPGTGWLGKAVPGILGGVLGIPTVGSMPAAFSGSLKSLTSVSPFLEGNELVKVGPLAAIGARALNRLLPETRALTDPIVGDIAAHEDVWEMLVPNSAARNVLKATIISDNRTQAKSVLDAVQYLEFKQNVEMDKWIKKGGKPDDENAPRFVPGPGATDMERAQFIDRVKNHARILGLMKAAVGAFSPVAPSVQIGEYKLKSDLYDLIKTKGIGVAIQEFLEKNPDATPYTVFQTDAGTPSPIESNHPTQQWVKNNIKFITDRKYSAAASYFVPQTDSPFDQSVYNEQMAMGLRRLKGPENLIRDIETSQGNRWYFDEYKPARDAALAKARSPREKTQISQTWASQGGVDSTGQVVQSLDSMKLQNPIWYGNFSSGGKGVQRQLALSQMRTAIADNAAPETPMTAKISSLIDDFDRHSSALLPGRTDSYAAAARKREQNSWQAYLKKQADEDPSLVMVINNVFRGVTA